MSDCGITNPSACAGDLAADAFGAMAESVSDAAGWAVKNLMTVWLSTPGPNLSGNSAASWLSGRMTGLILVVAFVSILWAAYKMATSGSFEHLSELALSLGRLIAISGCVTAVTVAGVQIGDELARWMLAGVDLNLSVAFLGGAMSPPIVMLLGLVIILTQLVQALLMLVKDAMVVLLVGFLPLTAAATNTPLGRGAALKASTWLLAFLLYKPVAAAIYAVGFKLSDRAQPGLASELSGVALMVLAVVALPALMRFLVPVTAAVAGGNAGAVAGAAVGATIASGAVLAAGAMSGGAGFAAAPAALQAAPTGASLGAAPAATGASTTSPDRQDT